MTAIEAESAAAGPSEHYLRSWELHGLLTNGEAIFIRPIRPDDLDLLLAFHASLSPETIHRRFLGAGRGLGEDEAARLVTVDYRARMGIVAFVGEVLVGLASYDRLDDATSADVGFVVSDAYQRHGVGTFLLEGLIAYARDNGITRFFADVAPQNNSMLDVFASTGLGRTQLLVGGIVRVDLDLRVNDEYLRRCDEREAIAENASVSAILRPRSIAVVGAGRQPTNIGHRIVRALLGGDFSGTVYPVNPTARSICGVPAYPSLSVLPEPVDLAIVAVPAGVVPSILAEAGRCHVRASLVITAGFGETGRSGAEVEAELLEDARRHGMRIVGPNCLGVLNTDPAVAMNATFADLHPIAGGLALATQSGAVGVVLAEQARTSGLGLSSFVSMGNKLDVSSNDLLCFFEADEQTTVIALYLESLGNPRKFARIARRVARKKPIVALKAGKTSAGARGAKSHTAAAATPEITVTALLKSAGVIKVDRLEELLDVSSILLAAPLPSGSRVALVGNSGGPLILAADACEMNGLSVPELGQRTRLAVAEVLAPAAALANPVDLTADGTASQLGAALEIVLTDSSIDAVIVVATDLPSLTASAARACVANAAGRHDKPVVACLLGSETATSPDAAPLATIASPERAAAALAHVCRYAAWRHQPASPRPPSAVVEDPQVREIVSSELAVRPDGGWLALDDAAKLLAAAGIAVLPTTAASSADEAAEAARSIGFPVVLKARSGSLVHKSEMGGVITDLASPEAVADAYEAMTVRIGASMEGVVLQPMATRGVEAIVGLSSDPNFGPVVMVGLGGVATDLLGDRSFGVPPLNLGEAAEMVSTLRSSPLLDGYRGSAVVDRVALVALIEKVARLAEWVPELVELDLNPVIVGPTGALAVDCKVRLAPRGDGPGPLFRALRPIATHDDPRPRGGSANR